MKEKIKGIFKAKKPQTNNEVEYDSENVRLKGGYSENNNAAKNGKNCCVNSGEKIKKFLVNTIQVKTSYFKFGIMFLMGIGITFLSLLSLPLIIINPKKFASLFALGTFVTISSFIFYYGTFKFFETLFKKERMIFTIMYILGFLGSLILPLIFGKNFFVILLCSGLEMLASLDFLFSFLPFKFSFMSKFFKMILGKIKGSAKK